MAITVIQEPRLISVTRQPLMHVFESDNSSETGFKLRILCQIGGVDIAAVYLSPNASGRVFFDASQFTRHLLLSLTIDTHNIESGDVTINWGDWIYAVQLAVTEWWMVDGVLTENSGSGILTDVTFAYNGYFDNTVGYSPDTEGSDPNFCFILDSNVKRWLSDRKYNTHIWPMAQSFGVTPSTQTIFIPAFENDWGMLGFTDDTSNYPSNLITKFQIVLYDVNGAPTTFTQAVGGNLNASAMVYPANLNNNSLASGLPKPVDFPGWRFYTVRALSSSDTPVSALYVFYNASLHGQSDCKFDRVRIGWANSRGSFDYFNFIKKNEEEITIDRRKYKKTRGYSNPNYPWGYDAFESGLTVVNAASTKYINAQTDWISENEFIFLQSLMVSRQVHLILDDGNYLPLVIDTSSYVVARERTGKLKNLSLRFEMANPYT